jgi:murein DD-endopeptidase MepM/ murein hydrolase activator NlpD
MTYLFSNPQVKKWKTMFFLSLFLNIILILTFILREHESADSDGQNELQEITESREISANVGNGALSDEQVVSIDENKDNYKAKKGDLIVKSVSIEDNFYSAFNRSEEINKVAKELEIPNLADLLGAHMARLLVWDLVLRTDVRKGDKCSFVFRAIPSEEQIKRKDLPDIIEVLSVKYYSNKYGKSFDIYSFMPGSSKYSKYYYHTGEMIEKLIVPFSPIGEYIQVTSKIADRAPKHDGVDFKSEIGTPVFSTVAGKVTRTNWMTKYNGYCVEIKEKEKPFTYKYLHLSDVLVKPGQDVNAGDHIANSGNTGKTTAPHLHYQINVGQKGDVKNPFSHHNLKTVVLSGSDLENFRQRVVELEKVLSAI